MKIEKDGNLNKIFYNGNSKEIIKEINYICSMEKIDISNILSYIQNNLDINSLTIKEKIIIYKSIYKVTHIDYYNVVVNSIEKNLSEISGYDFVGNSGIELSQKEKIELLMKYDFYELEKIVFLNKRYDNNRTKLTYYTLYKTNIHYMEKNLNKDLMYFSQQELQNLINSVVYSFDTTKNNIKSFITLYLNYCVEKNFIGKNLLEYVNFDLKEKIFLQNKIIGKNKFFDMLELMEEKTKLPNIIPLLLARYGIVGEGLKEMINLKWDDIDREKMIVNIHNEDTKKIIQLPIDSEFIRYIDKAKAYTESPKIEGKNIIKYDDFGYVLKKAYSEKNSNEKTIKRATVFNRVNEACKSIGVDRIGFKVLLLSRQLDILTEIRRYNRLTQKDFSYVVDIFNYGNEGITTNKAFILKKRWQELINDVAITQRKNTHNIETQSGEIIYQDIVNTYDLHL